MADSRSEADGSLNSPDLSHDGSSLLGRSSLVRISKFCSPLSDSARRRRRGGSSTNGTVVDGFRSQPAVEVSTAVSVRFLDSIPEGSCRRRRNSPSSDLFVTAYVEDSSVLVDLGVFEETTVCALYVSPADSSPDAIPLLTWSPIILRVLPKKASPALDTGDTNSSSDFDLALSEPALYIPPCVAATAGIYSFAPSTLRCIRIKPIGSMGSLNVASKMIIRELGRPLSGLRNGIQDEELRAYFRMTTKGERAVDCPRVMGNGNIFAVPTGTSGSETRFYEVVSIECDEDIASTDHAIQCYLVSPETRLVLSKQRSVETLAANYHRRLPNLRRAISFSHSVLRKPRHTLPQSMHPSIPDVVDNLLIPVTSNTGRSNYFTQLVGSSDDHVEECVHAAADAIGMRFLHIDGLAAFDYRCKKDSPNSPIVGSLAEKVSGLKTAIRIAQESSPCVLLVSKIDEELIDPEADAETRADEEKRFAMVLANLPQLLHQEISPSDTNCAPPLLILLSSFQTLPPGPLSSLSINEATQVSRPDENYARQIWSKNFMNMDLGLNTCPFEGVKYQLLGRTANEIAFLRDQFEGYHRSASPYDPSEVASIFERIVKDMEDGPFFISGGSGSKLSSSLIPGIKWKDVGGLSHVRKEVMDTIELPMRYPTLFASGGGRSGILLFGPPGTGKTLVAKAVATECHLPFLSIKGPELLGSYVGESEANVRAAFRAARKAGSATLGRKRGGGAILFFDELDSLAPRRGDVGDGAGVMERVVATLLGEMDSGSTESEDCRVFVIGATNRPDLLDPSILRPGRFDRLVYLGLAKSREDRLKILAAQTRKFTFDGGLDSFSMIDQIIDSIPPSLSGADLSAVAKAALMRSIRRLCDEADSELKQQYQIGESSICTTEAYPIRIESIIEGWNKDRLLPVVRAEDFIAAAKGVSPSVGKTELAKYEQLRKHFCA